MIFKQVDYLFSSSLHGMNTLDGYGKFFGTQRDAPFLTEFNEKGTRFIFHKGILLESNETNGKFENPMANIN